MLWTFRLQIKDRKYAYNVVDCEDLLYMTSPKEQHRCDDVSNICSICHHLPMKFWKLLYILENVHAKSIQPITAGKHSCDDKFARHDTAQFRH